MPGQVQIGIEQAQGALQAGFLCVCAGLVDPALLVAAVATDAKLVQGGQITRVPLVARENDAVQAQPPGSSRGDGGADVRGELLEGLALLQAVIVGEGVGTDLLPGTGCDHVQQLGSEMVGFFQAVARLDVGIG
ncbi:hypothetical protein D3C81_1525880 [compost metagenome]